LLLYGTDPIHGAASEPTPPPVGRQVAEEDLLANFCEVSTEYTRAQADELVRRIGDADAIISCWTNFPDEILSRAPNVRYIAFWTNAFAHRVNIKICEARGILVDYVGDYGTYAVTEYVIAAMLSLGRSLHAQQKDTLRGSWSYEYLKTGKNTPAVENIQFYDLFRKTIGIVGLGTIGSRVALTGSFGFGMAVSYYSRRRRRELEGPCVRYQPLADLVRDKDFLTLHLPPGVREPVVTRELMETMRPGTVLINTGSGRALDENAALDFAESGHLRLILDVYEGRPARERLKRLSEEQPGRHLFTYRAGWYTRDAITLKAATLQENIASYLEDRRST
jgi:lactate dehydrogenase-like 2-hydroxyacid dehydrogenase